MRNAIVILLLIILPETGICQSEYSARFTVGGANIGVSPSEEIWLTTKAGSLLYTDKIGNLWKHNPIGKEIDSYSSSAGLYERVTVFSVDTLMISGYIHGKNSNTDFVLWSGDKGQTWEEIKFGKSSWLDSFCHTQDGRAWMSGNTEYIYYTDDYGRTWAQIDKSHLVGNIRFIASATSPDGNTQLFGASWGEFYITQDNSASLRQIPTPHSQGKYKFIYNHSRGPDKRPKISKIRFYGDRYLITQDSRVFITRADSIDWQPLKNCYDYEVTEAGDLYTVEKDGRVCLYDNYFTRIWSSDQNMSSLPQSITCRNESLFAICTDEIYKINPEDFVVSGLFTDDFDLGTGFDEFLYDSHKMIFDGNAYAYDNRDVLSKKKRSKKWYRLMTVDFPIGNIVVFDGDLLVSDLSFDRYHKIDLDSKTISDYSFANDFIRISNNPVISFILETGTQGCFHYDVQYIKYNYKNDSFVTDEFDFTPQKVDENTISRLVDEIIKSRDMTISLSDLEITRSDVEEFKKTVDKEWERQKIGHLSIEDIQNPYKFPDFQTDLEFYKKTADSLYEGAIPDSIIDSALKTEYGNRSTTTDWKSVTIEFRGGQKLKIRNADDKPNYMLTPWLVDYEGVKFKVSTLSIGRILNELSNDKFITSPFNDKTYLIFNIANYLYECKLAW